MDHYFKVLKDFLVSHEFIRNKQITLLEVC